MRKLIVRLLSKIRFKASRKRFKAFSETGWVNLQSEWIKAPEGLYVCLEGNVSLFKIFRCN